MYIVELLCRQRRGLLRVQGRVSHDRLWSYRKRRYIASLWP